MNWNEEMLNRIRIENIDNIESKKRVAEKIIDKVKDGQVIRIWLWFNIFYSYNSNFRENKE